MNYLYRRRKSLLFFQWSVLLLLFSSVQVVNAGEKSFLAKEQTPVHKKNAEQGHDLLLGERLFYGLASFEAGKFNCEGCHYTISSEELNWNPSAYDLALWIADKPAGEVKKSFEAPGSQKMEEAHKNIKLTEAEIDNLKVYLEYIQETGLVPHKPFPVKGIIFFLFGILMAAALIDLIFTRYFKYRFIHATIIVLGLAIQIQMAMDEAKALSRTKNYAPDQPIKFSHKIHAGDNKIDCKYCHTGAETGKSAGLPSLNTCMNCHNVVQNGRNSGKFEIRKISEALRLNKSVDWIRIHKLPDHAFFSHAQHVSAGKVDCSTCHGPVQTMEIMKQYSDLSMGWCVNCHRQTYIQFDKNPYYSKNKKFMEMINSKKIVHPTVEDIGGLDCMKCHY
ncbi:MAG: cytochrome c3 family protein [Bacteroidales bacterium]